MKENMRLSIIIPVYNAEKYIKNCLDSLLRQNVGGIEILCIDDGSDRPFCRCKRSDGSRNGIYVQQRRSR